MKESAFLLVWWRFGWGRPYDDAIGGWRRLWWRLWWRTKPLERERSPLVRPPDPDVYRTPLRALHWSPDGTGVPFCAPLRDKRGDPPVDGSPWTLQWGYVTCADCRAIGEPIVLRHRLTTR